MHSVLVTGAAGELGRQVVGRLSAAEDTEGVVGVDLVGGEPCLEALRHLPDAVAGAARASSFAAALAVYVTCLFIS